jgi:hypothetical protein
MWDMTSTSTTIAPDNDRPPGRAAGIALLVCAALTLALLANHPSGAAATFADRLREEAANSGRDALVHGGFIAVLAIQFACLAIMTLRLGLARPLAIAGFVLTAIGAGFLMASMLLDGLVTPAVASRYLGVVDVAERQNDAKALFVVLGATISFLMPAGLLLQAAGLACWCGVFVRDRGLVRVTGIYGAVAAAAVIVAIAATGAMVPHLLIAALLLVAGAYALIGAALLRRQL